MSNAHEITQSMEFLRSIWLQVEIGEDLERAYYNEELKAELRSLPTWQLDKIFASIIANAGPGQQTTVRQWVNALQREIRPSRYPEGIRCDCNREGK